MNEKFNAQKIEKLFKPRNMKLFIFFVAEKRY